MSEQDGQMTAMIIGRMVMAKRKERGWTQAQLSQELELAQSTISRIERGLLVPDYIVLKKIGDLLFNGVSEFTSMIEEVQKETNSLAEQNRTLPEKKSNDALFIMGMGALIGLAIVAIFGRS